VQKQGDNLEVFLKYIIIWKMLFTLHPHNNGTTAPYMGGLHNIYTTPTQQWYNSPPSWGDQIEKKKFWRAKIRKNKKIWGKILIF
jgi:hypothetical protein